MDVFNQLKRMKEITPQNFKYDMNLWISKKEATRADVDRKVKGVYHEDQFIKDLFEGALAVPCKSFRHQIGWMKNTWLAGNKEGWTKDKIVQLMLKHYTNMDTDRTWQKELAETEQIISLATKVDLLQKQLDESNIRVTTPLATVTDSSNRRSKRQPYTVKPWRLEFKGESVERNGTK